MTTQVAHGHVHRPRVSGWLAGSAVVLVAATLVAGIVIGRSTKESRGAPVEGLASSQVLATIDGWMTVTRRGDFDAFARYLAKDVVYHEPIQGIAAMRGRKEVTDLSEGYYNLGARYYRIGPVIQHGDLAAYAVSCPPCPGQWSGIDVIQFNQKLEITSYWTGGNVAGPAPGSG